MKTKLIAIKENPLTFYALVAGILFSFIFYAYCINTTVRNGVSYGNTDDLLGEARNRVSELEYRYTHLRESLDVDSAKALGLEPPAEKIFISRVSKKPLSFNK